MLFWLVSQVFSWECVGTPWQLDRIHAVLLVPLLCVKLPACIPSSTHTAHTAPAPAAHGSSKEWLLLHGCFQDGKKVPLIFLSPGLHSHSSDVKSAALSEKAEDSLGCFLGVIYLLTPSSDIGTSSMHLSSAVSMKASVVLAWCFVARKKISQTTETRNN